MLSLYNEVMALGPAGPQAGCANQCANRVVKTGAKHFDQAQPECPLRSAGWDGLKDKEIAFF